MASHVSYLRERLTVAMVTIARVQDQTTDPRILAHLDGIVAELRELATSLEAMRALDTRGGRGQDSRVDDVIPSATTVPRLVTVWRRVHEG